MKIAYGYTIADDDDFFLQAVEETSQITAETMIPGRWLVDYYPLRESAAYTMDLRNLI